MKKIILLFIVLSVFTSCKKMYTWMHKNPVSVKEKADFLDVPEYSTPTSTYTSPVNGISTYGDSYWFVLVEDNDGKTRRNDFIVQNHTYFSYKEAIQHFKDVTKKDCFILFLYKVDKETYENNNDD